MRDTLALRRRILRRGPGPWGALAVVSVAVIAAQFLLSTTSGAALPTALDHQVVMASVSGSVGQVTSTLVLANDSIVPGNFVPANPPEPAGSVAPVYDASDGDVYVADSAGVSVLHGRGPLTTLTDLGQPLAYDPSDGEVYFGECGTLNILAGTTLVVTLSVGVCPAGAAYDSTNGYLYVVGGGEVIIIDGASIVQTISPYWAAPAVTYDPADQDFYFVTGSNVTVVSGASNSVVATIPIGPAGEPETAAYDTSNGYVYVTTGYVSVSVISGTHLEGTISCSAGWLVAMAFDPADGEIYLADADDSVVRVIDGLTIVAEVHVDASTMPDGLAYDDEDGDVYVAQQGWSGVTLISGSLIVAVVTLGWLPGGEAFDSANGDLYVTNSLTNQVDLIKGSRVVAIISSGSEPSAVTYDSANGDVYVANEAASTVSVFHGTSKLAMIDVGTGTNCGVACQQGDGIAFDGSDGDVYVSNFDAGTVTVIHGTKVVATIWAGANPTGVAYDPRNAEIYVSVIQEISDTFPGEVVVFQGLRAIAVVPINSAIGPCCGAYPYGVAFDSADGDVYVADAGYSSVNVISGTSLIANVSAPTGFGLTFDPETGDVYLTGENGYLYAISGETLLGSVPVGPTGNPTAAPYPVAFDPADGLLYVGDFGALTLVQPS